MPHRRNYTPDLEVTDWGTPKWLFDELNELYGPFDLDPCSMEWNAKCETFYTPEDNGLMLPWSGRVFMNPPYAWNITSLWVRKAALEAQRDEVEIVVGVLPSRTDAAWFHEFIYHRAELRFLKGRVKFDKPDGEKGRPRHGSMVVVWRGTDRPPTGAAD